MIVELKLDDIKPPPTDHIEFVQQILKPKPQPIIPKPKPKPVVKPIVHNKPRYTAPKATGAGVTDTVSALVVGNEGFPQPGYPYQAGGATGTVLIRITFDGSGEAKDAQIVQSSGVPILDSHTRHFILENWKNATWANRTAEVPVQYIYNR